MVVYFDIEANGLLDTITKVWCIGIKVDTLPTMAFSDLNKALCYLSSADVLI